MSASQARAPVQQLDASRCRRRVATSVVGAAWGAAVTLLFVGHPAHAAEVEVKEEEPPPEVPLAHAFRVGAQLGAGLRGEDFATMARPQLGYVGTWGQLIVSVPLWARWSGPDPVSSPNGGPVWVTDWRDPETYAAMLEQLEVSLGDDAFHARAGGLAQETLGYGNLVDQLTSSLDPAQPRTGARVDVDVGHIRVEMLADSVAQPHMLGAHVTLAPLVWVGVQEEPRLRVSLGGAVDPDAPRAFGRGPYGGGDLGVGYLLVRDDLWALEAYALGAWQAGPAVGAHWGLRLQAAEPRSVHGGVLNLQLEGSGYGEGYRGTPFDVAYQVERRTVAARGGRPRAALRPRDGYGLRGRLDAQFRGVRLGFDLRTEFRGEVSAGLCVGVEVGRVSASALLLKRDLRAASQLATFGPETTVVLEAAVRVWDGFYSFSSLHRGVRFDDVTDAPTLATDWVLGMGYAIDAG